MRGQVEKTMSKSMHMATLRQTNSVSAFNSVRRNGMHSSTEAQVRSLFLATRLAANAIVTSMGVHSEGPTKTKIDMK